MTDVSLWFYSRANGLSSLLKLTSVLVHQRQSAQRCVQVSGNPQNTQLFYKLQVCVYVCTYIGKLDRLATRLKSHSIHATRFSKNINRLKQQTSCRISSRRITARISRLTLYQQFSLAVVESTQFLGRSHFKQTGSGEN